MAIDELVKKMGKENPTLEDFKALKPADAGGEPAADNVAAIAEIYFP